MRYAVALKENEKNKRFYVEVRYARVSSSTLKETASIFRLKRNGRNLTTQEYADNLIKYMDDTESMNTLTLADLNTVLAQTVGNDGNCETEEQCEDEVIINTILYITSAVIFTILSKTINSAIHFPFPYI